MYGAGQICYLTPFREYKRNGPGIAEMEFEERPEPVVVFMADKTEPEHGIYLFIRFLPILSIPLVL